MLRFLELVQERCVGYGFQVFKVQGSTFMPFSRRRIYIAMVESSAGGDMAVLKMRRLLAERALDCFVSVQRCP